MKYKLIEVKNKIEENVRFGTCDLCYHLGTHHYDILVFEDEKGNRYEEENGFWSFGSYQSRWFIYNYVALADFIKDKEYPELTHDRYENYVFSDIINIMVDGFEAE